jgi:hypothetical protein
VGGGLGAAAGDFGFGNLWRRKGHKGREVLKSPVWRSGSGGRMEPFSFYYVIILGCALQLNGAHLDR